MPVLRTMTITALALAAGGSLAQAITQPESAQPDALVAQARLEVASGPTARAYPALTWSRAPRASQAAWQSFASRTSQAWQVLWDVDTGVPNRLYGAGIHMPGSMTSPQRAEAYARAFLAEHIDLLAPGSRPEDFEVVSNHFDGSMRTIGMYQRYAGMLVLSGQVSFRFKNDRLFAIGSEALPYVKAPIPEVSLSSTLVMTTAESWIRAEAAEAKVTAVDGPYVLPIVSHGGVTYRTVMRATVDASKPIGRWHVYVDAHTGEAAAREQMLHFAQGKVLYNVAKRYPATDRADMPALRTEMLIDGEPIVTDEDGNLTWPGDGPATITAQVLGPLVQVVNDGGEVDIAELVLAPGTSATWDARDDELIDAQVHAFIHAQTVKSYVRRFAPRLAFLDKPLEVRVNIDNRCNAFSDGYTINFFRSSDRCENTARLADVVYHEFGHALHWQSLIPGVGQFEGGFSEGLSDYLAATITNDPAMGIGFFYTDEPLRHIDPEDFEHRWPEDVAEIHYTGLIFAGAMWDLRKELIAAHGETQGVAIADRLFYAAVQRATNIPSTYAEILAADDDDGDLSNGTPNECLINHAFGRLHGLRELDGEHAPLGAQAPERDGYRISTRITGTSDRCAGDRVESVTVHWSLGNQTGDHDNEVLSNTVRMTDVDGEYVATIPKQENGSVVRYQVEVKLADGSSWRFPANTADPVYEFYVGELIPLYCTDFERDPFAEGWTHVLDEGNAGNGADDWQWGVPAASTKDDPRQAFSGTHVVGNDLGGTGYDGQYQPGKINLLRSPLIDVGEYSDVRIQYWRWLTVEDAYWDWASIYANGELVWRNRDTDSGKIHHLDSEWVFQDLPVSHLLGQGALQVEFELQSDGGLEFGGWTIDDFCVVARPDSICGDGVVTGAEECDDGAANGNEAGACRANCRQFVCGDGIVDTGEWCDDGNDKDTDDCASDCLPGPSGVFGCATSTRPGAPAGLLAMAILTLLWLRRRRA